jgi:hypothetical protein
LTQQEDRTPPSLDTPGVPACSAETRRRQPGTIPGTIPNAQ